MIYNDDCIGFVPALVSLDILVPMVGFPLVAFGKMSLKTITILQMISNIDKITIPAIAPDLNFLKSADTVEEDDEPLQPLPSSSSVIDPGIGCRTKF